MSNFSLFLCGSLIVCAAGLTSAQPLAQSDEANSAAAAGSMMQLRRVAIASSSANRVAYVAGDGLTAPTATRQSTRVAAANADSGAASTDLLEWADEPVSFISGPPGSVAARFVSDDLKVYASSTHLFPIGAIGIQCQGVNNTLAKSITAKVDTDNGATRQRFGQARSAAAQAFRFTVNNHDVLTENNPPRCEMLAYPTAATSLPIGVPFWFAISIWVDDWSGTQDEQIIAQWHQNDPRLTLNPFLALIVKGNTVRVELRHSDIDPATKASTTLLTPGSLVLKPRRWTQFVTRAKISQDADDKPFFQLWQDGVQIVDYSGRLGYKLSKGYFAYAKTGIYKWLNGNPWDASIPTREVMVKSMLIANDQFSRYTPTQISAAISEP